LSRAFFCIRRNIFRAPGEEDHEATTRLKKIGYAVALVATALSVEDIGLVHREARSAHEAGEFLKDLSALVDKSLGLKTGFSEGNVTVGGHFFTLPFVSQSVDKSLGL
jgi:hypothetical protein